MQLSGFHLGLRIRVLGFTIQGSGFRAGHVGNLAGV